MTLEPLPNETYIGTVVGLYCTVWLDSAVDTDVQVTASITPASEESQSFREANDRGNGAYQTSLVFSPLASGDGSVYVCNVSVQSANEHVVGTTANTAYSLTPLGTMQTVPLTLTRDLCSHIVLFQSSLSFLSRCTRACSGCFPGPTSSTGYQWLFIVHSQHSTRVAPPTNYHLGGHAPWQQRGGGGGRREHVLASTLFQSNSGGTRRKIHLLCHTFVS